jgi:hypothetical protein
MNLVTSEFRETVEQLIKGFKPENFVDAQERRLSERFHALPLGISRWSYGFLTSDGELIEIKREPCEVSRTKDVCAVICAIVIAARRFPQLKAFIPSRPNESIICPLCRGTKVSTRNVVTDYLRICLVCAGLGWRYSS